MSMIYGFVPEAPLGGNPLVKAASAC